MKNEAGRALAFWSYGKFVCGNAGLEIKPASWEQLWGRHLVQSGLQYLYFIYHQKYFLIMYKKLVFCNKTAKKNKCYMRNEENG